VSKTKIIRRPDRVEGGITPDEKVALDRHAEMWIKRIMRTEPIDAGKIGPAIEGLYSTTGLKWPRIAIVSSPLVMAIAGAFASGIWHLRKNKKVFPATLAATDAATRAATRAATDAATLDGKPYEWIYDLAQHFGGNKENADFLMSCLPFWYRLYQGGNMWGQYDCYLTAMRDVLGLRLPEHEKYKFWEQAAIEGGFRMMHDEFCIVSDFPEYIKTDDRYRPHSENSPSHRWRDGWSLYHVHGVRVPEYVVMRPGEITVQKIEAEENVEVRRVMIDCYGPEKYLLDSGAQEIGRDEFGVLFRKEVKDDEPMVMVRVVNTTPEPDGQFKHYHLRVPPDVRTAHEAVAWTFNRPVKDYQPLAQS
jgi:hypothetical protein